MSAEFSEELDPGIALQPRRGWIFRLIAALGGLVIFAGAAAYLFLNYYDRLLDTAPAAQLPIAVSVEETVSLEDFRSFQQDLTAKLEGLHQATADQQADLRRLADQVSALAAKVDNLQNAAVSAPIRPPVVAMSKKPAAKRQPASTISVGGAPLPAQTRQ
ncbi:hypothetical protein SAMN05444050_7039 [Afipia sp. GAS231]|nr:hypothetical protein SAMN05444050_7039 [Afipia sp. GAS231]